MTDPDPFDDKPEGLIAAVSEFSPREWAELTLLTDGMGNQFLAGQGPYAATVSLIAADQTGRLLDVARRAVAVSAPARRSTIANESYGRLREVLGAPRLNLKETWPSAEAMINEPMVATICAAVALAGKRKHPQDLAPMLQPFRSLYDQRVARLNRYASAAEVDKSVHERLQAIGDWALEIVNASRTFAEEHVSNLKQSNDLVLRLTLDTAALLIYATVTELAQNGSVNSRFLAALADSCAAPLAPTVKGVSPSDNAKYSSEYLRGRLRSYFGGSYYNEPVHAQTASEIFGLGAAALINQPLSGLAIQYLADLGRKLAFRFRPARFFGLEASLSGPGSMPSRAVDAFLLWLSRDLGYDDPYGKISGFPSKTWVPHEFERQSCCTAVDAKALFDHCCGLEHVARLMTVDQALLKAMNIDRRIQVTSVITLRG